MRSAANFFPGILRLLVTILFFTTCQKEYSYEGGALGGSFSGTAVFTFEGAGGNCTGNIVSGNYQSGITMNNSNTVQLRVNVTATGSWQVTTASINGMYFAASGGFSTTGMQSITLTGNGKPAAAGIFNYSTPVSPACLFTIVVSNAPVQQAGYSLPGAPTDCQPFAVNGNYIAGTAFNTANTVDVTVNVNAPGNYRLSTDSIDGVGFSKSGSFTGTGVQTVSLTGSGTPVTPMNLVFTLKTGTAAASCTFPVTIVNPAPLAVYVLESGFGSPAPCNYTVQGTYTNNIPVNNSNTVSVRVYVSVTGNFTIATNTVNGIAFSYTGTFASTGLQYVILKAVGTPAATGSFTYIPAIVGPHPLGGETCAFGINVN